ncbi:Peptidyl-prolyl cis-trans isomerase fkbp1a [Mactra antiquata]
MVCTFEEKEKGDGQTFPKHGQIVVLHYTGTIKGTDIKFDCSRERNIPFRFQLGKQHVIKAWEENIPKMSIGQRVTLTCPPEYAYGKRGYPGVYPFECNLF